ncbi:SDR family oxidoreductase [Candidatus Woesearchaeota archaeon]|nr:SDR family oxidoreductase [Candidatus Woesearchaeota archaeon]
MDLKDKVAIVTGASSGIGYEIARALAEKRASVILTARRGDLLDEHARMFREQYQADARAIVSDLFDEPSIDRLVKQVRGLYNGVDILVNAAGQFIVASEPLNLRDPTTNLADFKRVMEVNFYGPLRLIYKLLPYMRKDGVVVNISSDADRKAYPGQPGYHVSKAALSQLTRALAAENCGTDFYALSPGNVNTEMLRRTVEGNQEIRKAIERKMKLNEFYDKILQPGDISSKVLELVAKRPRLEDPVILMPSYEF